MLHILNRRTLNKSLTCAVLWSIVLLTPAIVSGCNSLSGMPEINNHNCYTWRMSIDRDYQKGHYAEQCQEQELGRNNKEYKELSIARIKACYLPDTADDEQCRLKTQELNQLLLSWSQEEGALSEYKMR